jgi:hypothetical protein
MIPFNIGLAKKRIFFLLNQCTLGNHFRNAKHSVLGIAKLIPVDWVNAERDTYAEPMQNEIPLE